MNSTTLVSVANTGYQQHASYIIPQASKHQLSLYKKGKHLAILIAGVAKYYAPP